MSADYERLEELRKKHGIDTQAGAPKLRRGRAPRSGLCSLCAGDVNLGEEVLFDGSYHGARHIHCGGRQHGRGVEGRTPAPPSTTASIEASLAARAARRARPRTVTIEDIEREAAEREAADQQLALKGVW